MSFSTLGSSAQQKRSKYEIIDQLQSEISHLKSRAIGDRQLLKQQYSIFNRYQAMAKDGQELTIYMGVDESLPFVLRRGFSGGEVSHRWTEGTEAVISIPLNSNNKKISQLIFDTSSLVSGTITQKLIISGQGLDKKEYEYNTAHPSHKVVIDIPVDLDGDLDIHFEMPNACKPCDVNPSNKDPRLLAISFISAHILFTKEAKLDDELKDSRQDFLDSLLLEDVIQGNLERVKLLVALGANLNGSIDKMAMECKIDMLSMLIDLSSKANGTRFLQNTYNKVKALMAKDEKMREFNAEPYKKVLKLLSDNMLKIAVKQGNLEEVTSAVQDFQADVNAQDASQETALHKACYLSYLSIVEFLLKVGARIDIKDSNGQIAIQTASGSSKDKIHHAIQHEELLRCIQKGDKEGFEMLLPYYVSSGQMSDYFHNADTHLVVAALKMPSIIDQEIRLGILKLLLENGAVVGMHAMVKDKPVLHFAVELDNAIDNKAAIKLLINAGLTKDLKDIQQQTVIQYARQLGKDELADYMLEKFKSVQVKRKHGIGGALQLTTFGKSDDSKQADCAASSDHSANTAPACSK